MLRLSCGLLRYTVLWIYVECCYHSWIELLQAPVPYIVGALSLPIIKLSDRHYMFHNRRAHWTNAITIEKNVNTLMTHQSRSSRLYGKDIDPSSDIYVELHTNIDNDTNNAIVINTNSSATPIYDCLLSSHENSCNTNGIRYITFPEYWSSLLSSTEQRESFLQNIKATLTKTTKAYNQTIDLFWEQIKYEAEIAVRHQQQAGPQLYQGILSQSSLLSAICTIISHEIATELITATTLKDLFMNLLTEDDITAMRLDLQAVSVRDDSIETAMEAVLFNKGFHALVCYRVGHRLWQANRIGLAYYIQSTVSRIYSADIHPACRMGSGLYLRVGVGVVIGETAVIGNDVSIFEGVTLGGTGKESGDRHPKVSNGVIVYGGGTVLGNIQISEGVIISAKSIVTKPIPPLAIVNGVPASIQSYRNLSNLEFDDNLQQYLADKYFDRWRIIDEERLRHATATSVK
jgi:serine O-acetyltransferase